MDLGDYDIVVVRANGGLVAVVRDLPGWPAAVAWTAADLEKALEQSIAIFLDAHAAVDGLLHPATGEIRRS